MGDPIGRAIDLRFIDRQEYKERRPLFLVFHPAAVYGLYIFDAEIQFVPAVLLRGCIVGHVLEAAFRFQPGIYRVVVVGYYNSVYEFG
jgi:hypothetical protein